MAKARLQASGQNEGSARRMDADLKETQINMLRYQYFGDPFLGTCLQSIYGGGHFRLFQQQTSYVQADCQDVQANYSGAYFLS